MQKNKKQLSFQNGVMWFIKLSVLINQNAKHNQLKIINPKANKLSENKKINECPAEAGHAYKSII